MRNILLTLALCLAVGAGFLSEIQAHAGVFELPHFVLPGNFALGLEPEIILTDGAGVGVNAKFTEGLSDLIDGTLLLGTGGGPRQFRFGGNLAFDFFPDIKGQPGIGLGTQAIYYRLSSGNGYLEITAIPYVHKTFMSGTDEIEPYFSVPFGIGLTNGNYNGVATFAVGSMFKNTTSFRYDVEMGIAISNSESYISGGVTYYH